MNTQSTPTEPDQLPTDTAFSLLSDPRRRVAVVHLADRDSPVTLDALASHVVGADAVDPDGATPTALQERVKSALHHVHLPKLSAADVVEYDHEAQTVTPLAVGQLANYLNGKPTA